MKSTYSTHSVKSDSHFHANLNNTPWYFIIHSYFFFSVAKPTLTTLNLFIFSVDQKETFNPHCLLTTVYDTVYRNIFHTLHWGTASQSWSTVCFFFCLALVHRSCVHVFLSWYERFFTHFTVDLERRRLHCFISCVSHHCMEKYCLMKEIDRGSEVFKSRKSCLLLEPD